VFTFGRDHERKCAVRYVRTPAQAEMIRQVVDAVHDLLEDKLTLTAIRPVLVHAFSAGGSGVWEQSGSWMRRIANENPTFEVVWRELALASNNTVRFRVACFMNEMPTPLALEIGQLLKVDRSKKVREMVQDRLGQTGD
jgi:hypothetical protein